MTTTIAHEPTNGAGDRTGVRSPMPSLMAATLLVHMGFGAVFSLLVRIQDRFSFPTWGLGLIVGSSFVIALASHLSLASFADRGHARLLMIVGVSVAPAQWRWQVPDRPRRHAGTRATSSAATAIGKAWP